MWPLLTAEQLSALYTDYDASRSPSAINTSVPIVCSICGVGVLAEKLYLVVDPPFNTNFKPKIYHPDCIIQYLKEHADNISDEILNFALRKE